MAQPLNDPWARREAWRYQGPFTRWNRLKGAFPGFGIAVVAFTAYTFYEYSTTPKDSHGHGKHEETH